MVKTIQKMKKVSLSYPERPKKTDPDCCDSNGNPDSDAFDVERRLQVDEIENGQVQG
jgi:hypothetical protein